MTTAVTPTTARNWSEVFPKPQYPDEGDIWETINNLLYDHAVFGRFGLSNTPHDFKHDAFYDDPAKCSRCDKGPGEHPIELTLSEMVILGMFRNYMESEYLFDEKYDFGGEQHANIIKGLGERFYHLLKVARAKPTVGHFVGQSFRDNEKAADRFLGNEPEESDND
jgi:hypothetical protein